MSTNFKKPLGIARGNMYQKILKNTKIGKFIYVNQINLILIKKYDIEISFKQM